MYLDAMGANVGKTKWARGKRGGAFISFVGVRLQPEQYERLGRLADQLNVSISDLVRSAVNGLTQIPLGSVEVGRKRKARA